MSNRTILLDANVIEQIGRGNQAAATALRQLRNTGATIYVSQQAYNEMVKNPAIPRTAAAKAEFLREMNIKVAPAGNTTLQQQVLSANAAGKGTVLSGTDIKVAAQARAINAEVWSFDRGFRNNAPAVNQRLGVAVAPETQLPMAAQGVPEDYRVARKLTGLDEIEIDLKGNVKRKNSGGGAGGSGGAKPDGSPPSPSGKIRPRINAAKTAFKMGIRGAFSAPSLASMIPDVILAIADRAAAKEAMKNIQVKFLKEGFARGVAAGLMAMTDEEVDLNLKNHVTHFRVRGMGDAGGLLQLQYILQLAENSENYAVDVGFYYCSTKSDEWRRDLRAKGLETLANRGYTFGENELFDFPFIDKLAYVIRHTTDAIIGPAIRFN